MDCVNKDAEIILDSTSERLKEYMTSENNQNLDVSESSNNYEYNYGDSALKSFDKES